MATFRPILTRLVLISSAALLLTGCPLSDDYYIDNGSKSVGGHSGFAGTGTTGGHDALGGAAQAGGTAGVSTLSACGTSNCANTCCNDQCADLTSDPSNCGTCGAACPGGQACVSGHCVSGWASMAAPPAEFIARSKAAYVAMGDQLFILGGADTNDNSLNDGAIYDPKTNRWTLISIDANALSTRRLATAVWTGSYVLVFGGRIDMYSAGYKDAAAYNPAADSWLPEPSDTTGRVGPIGVGSSLFSAFWGGWGANSAVIAGTERFDWSNSTWASASSSTYGDPGVLANTAWGFTGQYLYLYGGQVNSTTKTNAAYSYNLLTNAWASLGSGLSTGPTARWGAFGVWDGTSFYVWAGRDDTSAKNDGSGWSASTWKSMTATGAPAARWAPTRQTGWAFALGSGDLLFVGGQDALGNYFTNGGRYVTASTSSDAGTWTAIPSWPSGENHQWGVAAYVGGALVVWGGYNGTEATATGERWSP